MWFVWRRRRRSLGAVAAGLWIVYGGAYEYLIRAQSGFGFVTLAQAIAVRRVPRYGMAPSPSGSCSSRRTGSGGRWDASLDSSVGSFFRRALNPRTVPVRWYAAVLVVVLVLYVSPLVLDRDGIERRLIEGGPMAFLLVGLAFGALEEPGWRGYAQEGLQRELSVGAASLIIGIVWAVWHIPLFFIEGTYQWHLGVGTPAFWSFLAVLVATAPVFAWLYNGAGNATFAPVLAHGLGNVVGEITADPTPWASALVATAAGVVALLWMRRWSGRSQRLSLLDPYGRHQGPGL
jgi:uncharacterized protein